MASHHELVSNLQEQSKHNKVFSFFWQLSKWFGTEQALSSLPEEGTITQFCASVVNALNITVDTELPEWSQGETGQGVLLYGPHAFYVEPHILLSVLTQREVYFLAQPSAKLYTPRQFQDKMLLVSPTHLAYDAHKKRGIAGMMQKAKRTLFASDDMRSSAEIKEANKQTIQRASSLLSEGKVVAIFPTASANIHTTSWHTGIGQITAPLLENGTEVLLQPYSITDLRVARLLFEMRKKFVTEKSGTPVRVEIGWEGATTTTSVRESLTDLDPRNITDYMQSQYTQAHGPKNS